MLKNLRIATTNPGKKREFCELLEPLGFRIKDIGDLDHNQIVEDGDTFEANAIIKADTILRHTGEPTIADDSGLVVDALGGKPGIHSARYAGVTGPNQDHANNQKLLMELSDIAPQARQARFVCALALCEPDQPPQIFMGYFEGSIIAKPQGDNGFGYDPLFLVQGDSRTSAELSPQEKNALSHRGKAIQSLLAYLNRRHGSYTSS